MFIKDIRSKYWAGNKDNEEKARLLQYHVFRPLSFYLTWFFLKLGISANQTTLISFLTGICGFIFLISGGYFNRIAGLLFLHFWLLLDCVDGNIARYKESFTNYGQFLDILNDHILYFFFISMGVGLFNNADNSLKLFNLFFSMDPRFFSLVLGSWTSLIGALTGLIYQKFLNKFPQFTNYLPEGEALRGGRTSFSLVKVLVFGLVRWSDVIIPIGLIAAFLNLMDLFILFYALSTTGLFILIIIKLAKIIKNYEQ